MTDFEKVLDRYDVLWRHGNPAPSLEAFVEELNLTADTRSQALPELIAIDMEYRWRRSVPASDPEQTETAALGKAIDQDTVPEFLKPRPLIEDYTQCWPELVVDGEVPVGLIAEEFRIRHRWGDRPEIQQFLERFNARPGLEEALTEVRRELLREAGASVPSTPTEFPENERFSDHFQSGPTLPDLSALQRYRVLKTLGRGGMGDVFLAEDTQLDRKVALKTPHFLQGATLRDRFMNEAKAAATLRHPGICPVFDVGEVDGHPFLTMAYIEGQTLRDHWESSTPSSLTETVSVLGRIAAAMQVAHQAGIVHRDLKPANVMIEPDGNPVIMDFGLACRAELPADQRITKTGEAFGSPAYMSPEQVDGPANEVGPASDIYSLGVMLYEGLTGELPFTGSVTSVLVRIATETPIPPSHRRLEVSPELDQLCLQMLAKKPAGRPASMSEVSERLADIAQELHLETERVREDEEPAIHSTLVKRQSLTTRRRTLLLVAVTLVPIMILLGLIIFNVKTPYGPLRIEVAEEYADQIKVRVLQSGELIEVADNTSGWSLSLKEGEYEFELGRGGEQFEIEPKRVEVSKDDEAVVVIHLSSPARDSLTAGDPATVASNGTHLPVGIRPLPGLIAEPKAIDGVRRSQLISRWPRAEPCCHEFSPDGVLYAIASQDGYVRIFENGPEGRLKSVVHVREQGNRPTFGFDWSADSKMLATVCNDWIQIWSISGQLLHEWQFKATDLQWHPRENILGSADRTGANVWKADGSELVRVDTWGSDRGSRFAWSADGESFLTVNGRFALMWSRTGEMIKRIPTEFTVNDLAWSPDGTRIAVMTDDKQAIVMSPDGDVLAASPFQSYGELDLRWSPDSQTFAISDQDYVTIYDREGTRLTRYQSMQFKTSRNCFTFSPDGQQHLIVKTDGAIEIHNARTGERAQHLSAGSPRISGVDWNQNSDLIVASVLSQRYPLTVVSRKGRVLHLPPPEATSAFDVAWDQSSGDIILGGDWWLWRFKSRSGDSVEFRKGDKIAVVENGFRIIAVHPEGSMIAGAGYSESVLIVDASGSPTKRLALDRPVFALSFSPDGKWLAVNTGGDAVTVFDASTWEKHRQIKEPNVYGASWSSDSSNIATMISGGAVKVFDLGGQLKQQFEQHWRSGRDVSYRALAWSPDGQWIVSSRDIDVQAYNLSTGERRQFSYHVELVMDAVWISASEFVVVARDGTISGYDVESGRRVWLTLVLEDRSGRLQSVTVSAEGEILHADESVNRQLHYLRESDSGQFDLQPFGG